MKRVIFRITAGAALLATLATATVPATLAGEVPEKFKIGDAAVDFTLKQIDGSQATLSKAYKDKVVLLAFWSLRCGACLSEVPFLDQLYKKFSGKGATVLSVVTDGVDATATKTIMKETGIAPSYPVLVDPDFQVSDTYTNFVVPFTLVIDRKGVVRYVHTGFEPGTDKKYEAAIVKALEH